MRRRRVLATALRAVRLPAPIAPFVTGLRDGVGFMSRPFDGFWELFSGRRGNLFSALFLLVAYSYVSLLERMNTAFIFNMVNPMNINVLSEFLNTAAVFVLWCGVHWALSVLNDGKGTFRQIVMVAGYSLLPMIFFSLAALVASQFLTVEEGALVVLLQWTGKVWSAFLLFAGTATIQQFTGGKTVLSILLTVIGMGIVLFLGLLFFSVTNLMGGFLTSIYTELVLRF